MKKSRRGRERGEGQRSMSKENVKTFDNAYFVGKFECDQVNLNGFLLSCFSKEEIEDILYSEFQSYPEQIQKKFVNDYYDANPSTFERRIKKKCK